MNAICSKQSQNLEGCKMYVTLFPCNECAKLIIQSGIKKKNVFEWYKIKRNWICGIQVYAGKKLELNANKINIIYVMYE